MGLLVLGVEKSSREHYQISHDPVLGIHPEDLNVPFLSSTNGNSFAQRNHGRCGDDAGHVFLRRLHVGEGKWVGRHVGDALAAADVLGINEIGADSLDLVQHVLLAGHADGDYQDQRRRANHHAQRGQREADFVATKGVVGEIENFPYRYGTNFHTNSMLTAAKRRRNYGQATQSGKPSTIRCDRGNRCRPRCPPVLPSPLRNAS